MVEAEREIAAQKGPKLDVSVARNRMQRYRSPCGVSPAWIASYSVPGTQNTTVETVLSQNDIWMMAGAGYKPLTSAYNSGTPITIEMDPLAAATQFGLLKV